MQTWPYPAFIAHRGAGKLAPENTLAAFRLGAHYGYRMFECDVKLSCDGVPFLLHDNTLERTSTGRGVAGEQTWEQLSFCDAGIWHSRGFAGEPLATLQSVAQFCLANGFVLNIEIKPTEKEGKAGDAIARTTGRVISQRAAQLWARARTQPLLSSFSPASLVGAREGAEQMPRGLLCDSLWDGWLQTAVELECVAVVLEHRLIDTKSVAAIKSRGMRCLCYTVNSIRRAGALLSLGVDGLITDRVDLLHPLESIATHMPQFD